MTDRFDFIASPPADAPPANACDCHTHVFGPIEAYPFAPRRAYAPMDALPEDAASTMRTLGIERIVLVQPSPYGADNRCMLYGLQALGRNARGVAVIDETTPDAELRNLHEAGVRGARLNIASGGNEGDVPLPRRIERLCGHLADHGWHLQLFIEPDALVALETTLARLPVPFVLDHMGLVPPDDYANQIGFKAIIRLLDTDRCWVKLSGPYRLTGSDSEFAQVAPMARALVDARPDRLVWGSDWPHTPRHSGTPDASGVRRPYRAIDTGRLLDLLTDWAPEAAARERILVANPAALYDFD